MSSSFFYGGKQAAGYAELTSSSLIRRVGYFRLFLGLILLSLASGLLAAPSDDDPVSSINDASDRAQRLEQLRSSVPSSSAPAAPNVRGRYMDSDGGYRTPSPPPSKVWRSPATAEPSRSVRSAPSHAEIVSHNVPSRSIRRSEPRKRTGTGSATTKPKVKASVRPQALASDNVHISRKSSGASPRCGFCLVDGYVYCGGQSVSLRQLIEQDHRQKGSKHPRKRKMQRIKHHHSASVPKKRQKKLAPLTLKKPHQRR